MWAEEEEGRRKNRVLLMQPGVCKDWSVKTSFVCFLGRCYVHSAVSSNGSCRRNSTTGEALRAGRDPRPFGTELWGLQVKAAARTQKAPINWNFPSISEPPQFYLCHWRPKWILSRENGLCLKLAAMWWAVNFPGRWSDGGTCKVGGM